MRLSVNRLRLRFLDGRERQIACWLFVAVLFLCGTLALLYVLCDVFRLPLLPATLLAAEITTLLRFVVNDRWVFGFATPSWARLWQYHAANAAGFGVWCLMSNVLARFGLHYLLASLGATAFSVMFSLLSNFLWVWRCDLARKDLSFLDGTESPRAVTETVTHI